MTMPSVVCLTFHGKDAMVSDITRTAPKTADNCIAVFSVTAIPVLDSLSANSHSAGFDNDVDGRFGLFLNAPKMRPNKF